MYGFVNEIDYSQFVDHNVELVCYAENMVTIHISGKIMIECYNPISYKWLDNLYSSKTREHEAALELIDLVGSVIKECRSISPKCLRITLEKNKSIEFIDNSKQFETFCITINGISYYV